MAQRAPDWVSNNQLGQALQASANVPADLATMTSEPEQLESQPTNAQLNAQFQQFMQQMQQQTQQFQQQMQQTQQQMQHQFAAL
jgi:hypothetical protein